MTIEIPAHAPRTEQALAVLPFVLRHAAVLTILQLALAEDLSRDADWAGLAGEPAAGDVTSTATILPAACLNGRISAKADGVVAGLPVAHAVFLLVDPGIAFEAQVQDGQRVVAGDLLAEVKGPGRSLLAAERCALNFIGRISGIATLTRQFVDAVAGTRAVILDTRKTAPGMRHLDKYAVRMGGGSNHRMGLYDMAMVKDNHIDGAGGIALAVERLRQLYGGKIPIEVEVKNLEELEIALGLPIERIMLDNMDLATMREAVARTAGRVALEASGNVSLQTVRSIAETGVDFISSGALTHSAPVLDISMRLR
ncbi:MAG: carboxylating nicotinate-nucleotide diphosphorylase [Anaerolineales bacterium]|nr:carboxylating nicotinate-nucleotide diphosphorylase [Anaerolineales bacterium]